MVFGPTLVVGSLIKPNRGITLHFQSFRTSYFCASYDFPTNKVISNLLCVWSSLANCLAMQFRRAARCGPLVSWQLFAGYWRSKRLLIGRGAVCQTIWYILQYYIDHRMGFARFLMDFDVWYYCNMFPCLPSISLRHQYLNSLNSSYPNPLLCVAHARQGRHCIQGR